MVTSESAVAETKVALLFETSVCHEMHPAKEAAQKEAKEVSKEAAKEASVPTASKAVIHPTLKALVSAATKNPTLWALPTFVATMAAVLAQTSAKSPT